jgi:hypothetical protein
MRENRTYGSEGGETGQPVFPTPILPWSLRDENRETIAKHVLWNGDSNCSGGPYGDQRSKTHRKRERVNDGRIVVLVTLAE